MTEELNQCHKYLSTLRFVFPFLCPFSLCVPFLLLPGGTNVTFSTRELARVHTYLYIWILLRRGTTKYCDWINYSEVSRKKYRNIPERKCCVFSSPPACYSYTLLLHLGDKMSPALGNDFRGIKLTRRAVESTFFHAFIFAGESGIYICPVMPFTPFLQT